MLVIILTTIISLFQCCIPGDIVQIGYFVIYTL